MWEVAWAAAGTTALLDYLKNGWEPFAALRDHRGSSYDPESVIVWLKKWHD